MLRFVRWGRTASGFIGLTTSSLDWLKSILVLLPAVEVELGSVVTETVISEQVSSDSTESSLKGVSLALA